MMRDVDDERCDETGGVVTPQREIHKNNNSVEQIQVTTNELKDIDITIGITFDSSCINVDVP